MEPCENLPPDPPFDLQADNRRMHAIVNEYCAERQKWLDMSGRQLPSKEELIKLAWKRARKGGGQEARASM
jgi:hypothetical protein